MFVILFIGLSFSQSTSLSLYGVGEKYGVTDVSTIALGNSTFFSGNKYNISTNSPSSLWRSALTRFAIYSGINYLNNPKKQSSNEQQDISINLTSAGDKAVSLNVKNGAISIDYVLSDLSVIPEPPSLKRLPEFETKIKLDNSFIDTFIKGKSALSDVDMFTFISKDGKVEAIIGT